MDTPMFTWLRKTYIHHLCADIGCHLEDLPSMMADRDGWQGRESREYMLSAKDATDDDEYSCVEKVKNWS